MVKEVLNISKKSNINSTGKYTYISLTYTKEFYIINRELFPIFEKLLFVIIIDFVLPIELIKNQKYVQNRIFTITHAIIK